MTGAGLILEGRGITRRYPGTVALDAVDFRVYRNQVNVLIGENGAGKSTLMRILAGVEPADSGELLLDGARVAFRSPRDASRHGIAIVHQELSILPNLDLTDNLFAGRELRTAGLLVNRPDEERRSLQALQRLQRPMDVRSLAGHLPLGCRQLVEIARALDQQAKILILDEPTSALSNPEAESLFSVIAELKRSGVTVIYISHRLNELLYLGDFFTVLRSGRVVGEGSRAEVNRQWIVQRMSGRDIQTKSATPAIALAKQMLKVDHLTLAPGSELGADMVSVREISFTLGRGEILGVYGLLGSGRTELLEAIAGLRRVARGTIELEGKSLRIQSARNAIDAGIHLVPEDRQRDAIVPELSVRENMGLAGGRGMFLRPAQETEHALQLIKDLNIRTPDLEVPITALSGGNQQRF